LPSSQLLFRGVDVTFREQANSSMNKGSPITNITHSQVNHAKLTTNATTTATATLFSRTMNNANDSSQRQKTSRPPWFLFILVVLFLTVSIDFLRTSG